MRHHVAEEEAGRVQIYPPNQFLGTVLPGVTDEELRLVTTKLNIPDNAAWIREKMGGTKPSDSDSTEAEVFSNITTIFNEVAEAVSALYIGCPLIYAKQNPTKTPEGDVEYKTKPDGYDVLKKTQLPAGCKAAVDEMRWRKRRKKPSDASWVDIAGTKEYILKSNEKNEQDVCLFSNHVRLFVTKS